jgi:hypothetical protein
VKNLLQIYGQFAGHWSNCGVSRGLARGLAANGVPVHVFETSQAALGDLDTSLYKDVDDLQISLDLEAQAALFVGYPVHSGLLDSHDIKIGAFIAESERLPPMWVQCADRCDIIAVPSDWLRGVFIEHGISADKVLTVPHGIDPWYFKTPPKRAPKMDSHLRFLHISGARDFPHRKGTPQLIAAFKKLFGAKGPYKDLGAQLVIRTPDAEWLHKAIEGSEHLFELDLASEALPALQMRHVYCNHITALVQPSAAEAFGICPLEARALRIPVICTHCTGHTQHASSTDTIIVHQPSVDMKVNGIPKGKAPKIKVADVMRGLIAFMNRLRKVATEGPDRADIYCQPEGYWGEDYKKWTWPAVTKPLAERILELL